MQIGIYCLCFLILTVGMLGVGSISYIICFKKVGCSLEEMHCCYRDGVRIAEGRQKESELEGFSVHSSESLVLVPPNHRFLQWKRQNETFSILAVYSPLRIREHKGSGAAAGELKRRADF